MRQALTLLAAVLVAGCAGHPTQTTVDTRSENVALQRLHADGGGGSGQVQAYTLQPREGYRMPQLYAAPDPVVGASDPRRELAPTVVCLQVVVTAEGRVERSVALTDRPECSAGAAAENAPLLRAAQAAVAQWRYTPAAVCRYAVGQVPDASGDCRGAEQVQPVAVSLLYAFTFEIVHGQHVVRRQGR
ncbi:hypothetical protein [Stenotrophomonas sp.]|uniref:hypothetical protein n=1 Tax=Stenotrophomonas sp. TaxID=69392 RepID=UPI002FC8558A